MDKDIYKHWSPSAQEKALELLHSTMNSAWKPFYCPAIACDGKPHGEWAWNHARKDQRPPTDDEYFAWLIMSGRGSGKTRTGSEYSHRVVRKVPRIIIVAPTSADLRDVIVDGESGILATSPPGFRPEFEPSKRRLTWPNGATGMLLSGEEPERFRGPQAYWAWLDEAAIYPRIEQVWSNLLFGLRLGRRPRVLITTTPRPRPWLKTLMADARTRISRASTYDNLENLAPTFAEAILKKYEGTRIGRQELNAEFLTDVEGALWTWELIESCRIDAAPDDLERIVVAVDPAGSDRSSSDETGIVVVGVKGDNTYILDDLSGKYSPNRWANIVATTYENYSADAIVAEKNFGGDMVKHTLLSSGVKGRLIMVNASRGKRTRAEPVLSLFEQGRCLIVGSLPDLEVQLAEWVPFEGASPDRLDAMVWGVTSVSQIAQPASVASPLRLIRGGAA